MFEKIPLHFGYEELKSIFNNKTDGVCRANEMGLTDAVDASIDCFFDVFIEENGMKRVALVIFAFLYELERREIDPELAKAVKWHIEDFEEGDYESLFKPEDLKDLKEDIQIIKNYLEKHPELLN